MGKAKKAKAKAAGQVKAGVAKKMMQRGKKQRKSANFGARSKAGGGVGVAAAYAKGLSSGEPQFSRVSRAGVIIRHRELVSSVIGSTAFTVATTLALNPGLVASFPWLSTQAAGWEQYRFRKLKFCYYTRTATSTPGSIMLVPDYDALDAAPLSEQVASAYRDVEEEVPWVEEFSCSLDPVAMHPDGARKYVRAGALPANADLRLSDVGNMFVCTVDGTAVNWGKLWVEYDVEFFVPQLPPAGVAGTSANVVAGGTVSKTAIFGTAAVITGNAVVSAAASTMTFAQPGTYLVDVRCTGTGMGSQAVAAVGSTATVTVLNAGSVDFANGGATSDSCQFLVAVTAPNQTFIISTWNVTTVTASTTRVAQYSGLLA